MPENNSFHFRSSTVKIPQFLPIHHHRHHHHHHHHRHHRPLFADLHLSISSAINNSKHSLTQFISSINTHPLINKLITPKLSHTFHSKKQPPLLCSASLALTKADEEGGELTQSSKSHSVSRNDDERVLISEVLVRNKDGEELERKDLEEEAIAALKRCRPNSALTMREVQEDVHRIIGSGYFCSCMPVAVDTRDGIRLVFQVLDKVEPNQEFQGLICEGANVLPTKFVEDKFRDGYGKIVNIRRLDEVINSINGWYMERGLFGLVSGVEILSGGILRLQVSEAEVNNISIRFLNKTGEPTTGKTRPETILRQLNTKKGQVYSMLQAKRDVDTLLAMGIMEDVSIVPQPAGDSGKVDLTINAVERVSGGISAGGGISSGITSGPLAGLIGSCAVYHRNLFGRNQKINLSLERGQIDSIFRINYTDPWIEGDDKRTSRTIMIQAPIQF
ncbi:putative bacterial surface antigen (D15), POTRA domain, surface antigen D15 [Helianthus anomalus]